MGRKRRTPPPTSPTDDFYFDADGKPIQRNAANARERARMRVLSKAFGRLKTTLPWVPPDTKLSKLDTLRLASSYIAHLRQVLAEDCQGPAKDASGNMHPITLTWPFTFNGKVMAPNPVSGEGGQAMEPSSPTSQQMNSSTSMAKTEIRGSS